MLPPFEIDVIQILVDAGMCQLGVNAFMFVQDQPPEALFIVQYINTEGRLRDGDGKPGDVLARFQLISRSPSGKTAYERAYQAFGLIHKKVWEANSGRDFQWIESLDLPQFLKQDDEGNFVYTCNFQASYITLGAI